MPDILLKRAYDPAEETDGTRILVDRLWPRGISKVKASLSEWDKDIAPENSERKSFHDGQEDWETFSAHYLSWLDQSEEAKEFADHVKALLKQGNVTFVYGSRDRDHNNAQVLKAWIESK